MKTFWRLSVSAVCGAAIKDVQLETDLEACSFLQTEMKLKNQKPENTPECRVWQHTYVQNAACNHFGSGQAGGVLVTGARRSDTGFLATLLQGLGLDVSDAQQKERGKDGAVSWAHAFHGACEKEDLSDHGEKLFSKAYLLTRHPLDQITHAAAEDGDLGETCGLDLGLSVFAQPTTWSDRLKLAMKHYVLLTSFVDQYAEKTFKLEDITNPKFDLIGDLCRELGSSATSTVDCSNAKLAKAVTGTQKSIAKDEHQHENWIKLTNIDRSFAAIAQQIALRHNYHVSQYQLLPEAGWGFDCGFDPNGLWSCALTPGGQGLLSRDFNLPDLIRSRQMDWACKVDLTEEVKKSKVLVVSVARAGSTTGTAMMKNAGQASLHNHQCNAKMLLDAGVGNVIVSLRSPVARFVSSTAWTGNLNTHYVYRMGGEEFGGSHGKIFDAMKDKEHALHSQAMDLAYRPFSNGQFVPLTFYLDGIKKDDPRVNIVCTCTLSEDVEKVLHKLDLHYKNPEVEYLHTHQSGDSDDPKHQAKILSQSNIDWIKKIYAEDEALYKEYCSRCEE